MVDVTEIIVGPATLSLDGVDVGATQDGVTVRRESDYLDISADQVRARLAKHETEVRFFVATTLKQGTLANLAKAWGLPAPSGTPLTLGLAAPSGKAAEHSLTLVGPAPGSYATRTYTVRKAVSISTGEHRYGKDQETQIAVEFECLADLSTTQVTGEAVGTGDGTETTFTLANGYVVPHIETIYVDGVAKVLGLDYSIDYEIGEVTFRVAPEAGQAITADYLYFTHGGAEFGTIVDAA